MKSTSKPTKRAAKSTKASVFTDEELEALKDTKAERSKRSKGGGEADLLAKIAELPEADRVMAEKVHAIVKASVPELSPTTWYGMPAWANTAGKAVCFFTPAVKFKERYATFGFNTDAKLDDGSMWPTSFALTKIGETEEKKIAALVKKAMG